MDETKLKRDYADNPKWVIAQMSRIVENGGLADEGNRGTIMKFLQDVDYDNANAIGEFVASIFGIDRAGLLGKNKTVENIYARDMWWMALYYLLKKSYREIWIMSNFETEIDGRDRISKGIEKLKDDMKTNFDLCNKWDIISEMVRLGKHPGDYENGFSAPVGREVRVIAPQNIKISVSYEK